MAQNNVIPNAEVCSFRGMTLHGNFASATYSRKQRIAVHEFLKRPGAQTEDLAREPLRIQVTLIFVGDDFRKDFNDFNRLLSTGTSGTFVDPIYGSFPATCEGYAAASIDVDKAGNQLTVPVSFVENSIDNRFSRRQGQGVATAYQAITSSVDDFAALANIPTSLTAGPGHGGQDAPPAGVVQFLQNALTYAQSAYDAGIGSTQDPSLPSQLDGIAAGLDAVYQAIESHNENPAVTYQFLAGGETIAAACVEMQMALLAARPPTGPYSVPVDTHIGALAQQFYGSDGLGMIDEILANNPGIPHAGWIPAGTVLILASPTI